MEAHILKMKCLRQVFKIIIKIALFIFNGVNQMLSHLIRILISIFKIIVIYKIQPETHYFNIKEEILKY